MRVIPFPPSLKHSSETRHLPQHSLQALMLIQQLHEESVRALKTALLHGATLEPGEYYLDGDVVKQRKVQAG